MSIYADMQAALAQEVAAVAAQGDLIYSEPGGGGDPFNPPTAGQDYPVQGWNITGNKRNKYIDGGYIIASDVLLSVVPFGVVPTLAGAMSINGVVHQIVMVDPATLDPDNPVVWRIGCRK